MTAVQAQACQDVVRQLASHAASAVLLYGPRGAGKRSIVDVAAGELGAEVVRVDFSLGQAVVLAELDDQVASIRSDRVVVVTEGLERLSPDNASMLMALCERRRFSGRVVIPADSWIIGTMEHASPGDPPLAAWSAAFPTRIHLASAVTPSDLWSILLAALQSNGIDYSELRDTMLLELDLSRILTSPASIRRYADFVVARCGRRGNVAAAIRDAARHSWNEWLGRVVYRGGAPSYDRYEHWLEQLGPDVREVAQTVVCAVVEHYYIDAAAYWSGMRELVVATDTPDHSDVIFCRWQELGESAPRVQRDLKSVARWRVVGELDLDDESTWSLCDSHPGATVMLVDDFVGTGTQLVCATRQLCRLAAAHPSTAFVLAVLAGFKAGFEHALSVWERVPDNVRVASVMRLDSSDTCGLPGSGILTPDQHDALQRCSGVIGARLRSDLVRSMGYGGLASLVVFPDFMPNTNLPLLWYDNKPSVFVPLIPRSGWAEEVDSCIT